MRKLFIALCVMACLSAYSQQQAPELWYKQPAAIFTEALPVGNGRLGVMVFGNPQREQLLLNEESVWAGSKINNLFQFHIFF